MEHAVGFAGDLMRKHQISRRDLSQSSYQRWIRTWSGVKEDERGVFEGAVEPLTWTCSREALTPYWHRETVMTGFRRRHLTLEERCRVGKLDLEAFISKKSKQLREPLYHHDFRKLRWSHRRELSPYPIWLLAPYMTSRSISLRISRRHRRFVFHLPLRPISRCGSGLPPSSKVITQRDFGNYYSFEGCLLTKLFKKNHN